MMGRVWYGRRIGDFLLRVRDKELINTRSPSPLPQNNPIPKQVEQTLAGHTVRLLSKVRCVPTGQRIHPLRCMHMRNAQRSQPTVHGTPIPLTRVHLHTHTSHPSPSLTHVHPSTHIHTQKGPAPPPRPPQNPPEPLRGDHPPVHGLPGRVHLLQNAARPGQVGELCRRGDCGKGPGSITGTWVCG